MPHAQEGIAELAAWLQAEPSHGCGMESTGVYWKPVWNALEGDRFASMQSATRAGDSRVEDRPARWNADRRVAGLREVAGELHSTARQRELRDLTRMRARSSRTLPRVGNRMLKVLEDAQIKLDCVASDPLGLTGQLILDSLLAGETDPARLAGLAQGSLKKKKPQLQQALDGNFGDHHRFQIRLLLRQWREHESMIGELDQRIEQYLAPHEDLVQRLDRIPGVNRIGIADILAEIGPDMRPWEEARKLASWGCLCPGNRESAGKRLSGRTRSGNRWLRRIFCQMAWAATTRKAAISKHSTSVYRRGAGNRGPCWRWPIPSSP